LAMVLRKSRRPIAKACGLDGATQSQSHAYCITVIIQQVGSRQAKKIAARAEFSLTPGDFVRILFNQYES